MTTETPPQQTEPVSGFWRLVPEPSLDTVRRWGWASVVANIGIVATGGLVRLTGSGLGCPTWPRCTPDSYVATPEMGVHGVIEFGNRLLTFVLVAVAGLMFLAAAPPRGTPPAPFWLSFPVARDV